MQRPAAAAAAAATHGSQQQRQQQQQAAVSGSYLQAAALTQGSQHFPSAGQATTNRTQEAVQLTPWQCQHMGNLTGNTDLHSAEEFRQAGRQAAA
jgi:hypothetical protein